MMTMDERVEAAAIAYDPIGWRMTDDVGREQRKRYIRNGIAAGVPELHGSEPTHWLAPMEATGEMRKSIAFGRYTTTSYGGEENTFDYISEENAAEIFIDMRDDYLGKGDDK